MNPKSVVGIILAGGNATPEFTTRYGVTNRAMVALNQQTTMLDYVVDAVVNTPCITEVVIVGDVTVSNHVDTADVSIVKPGESLIENVLIGLKSLDVKSDDYALLVSADIPFVTPKAIEQFVNQAWRSECDFNYPIIPMSDYRREFSGMKRTTLKLSEGEFTGGNIMLVRAGLMTDNPDIIRNAYANRKSPLALGTMLGWGLVAKILISQLISPRFLTIPEIEQGVTRVLKGYAARAHITPFASIGTDVDSMDDVEYARDYFSKNSPDS